MKRFTSLLALSLFVAACSESSEIVTPITETTDAAAAMAGIDGSAESFGLYADLVTIAGSSRIVTLNATAAVEDGGVVLPSAFANTMASSNNRYPFATSPMRYQQVFLGSELGSLSSIGGLCIRRDDWAGGPAQTQSYAIKMGPTEMDYTNLGTSFDGNYSAAPTTVFVGSADVPESLGGGTPDDFFFCIEFDESYHHPAGSNFLVEVVNNSASSTGQFNDFCYSDAGCTTRRIYAWGTTATNAGGSLGGMIMKFLPGGPGNPETKADCKNDGWVEYGFMNQGQCVRYVETGKDSRA